MRYFLVILTGILFTFSAWGQTLTPVYFPSYMQGSGTGERRVPYVCRFTVSGLSPNAVYRYINHFVPSRVAGTGLGACIFVKPDGSFIRVANPALDDDSHCGQFTTDASGSYTGWFINEADASAVFTPGITSFFRITLNDGAGGSNVTTKLTYQTSKVSMIDLPSGGTAIRSTPATQAVARNFVLLYENADPAPGERPITGTFLENDGTDNSLANGYADFYADHVNTADKTWGAIIPNNLPNGIRRIAQFGRSDGQETGFKQSEDGNWAKAGGGTVSTVNNAGGLTDVIVLDGNVITLGIPVAQPQTITFPPLDVKVYGADDFDAGATASSQLPVVYSSNNPAVAEVLNGTTLVIRGAGTADITASQAGNADYLPAPAVTQTLTVHKAPLTITADDKVKVQGDPLPAFTVSYSGFVRNEDASVLTTPPIVTTVADANTQAGEYAITASGAAAANYDITYVAGKLTVTASKQQQTITFGPLPIKTYGDPAFDPGASITSGLAIQYESSDPAVADIVAGKIRIRGTGTVTITAAHPGDANFEPAVPATQTLTIGKAPLTIRADNQSKLVGQQNPVLTISYEGFVYNETSAVLTTQPVIATAATAGSPIGDYAIKVEGAAAAHYDITYVNGILKVQPLPAQTISFPALAPQQYGNADFAAGAVASSGLPVSYTSSNTQVAVVENGMIKIKGAGTTNITAAQPGDALHAPAQDIVQPLTVQKAPLIIQAVDTAKLEGQPNPSLEIVYSGFVNGENASVLTAQPVVSTVATERSVAGRYVISVTGAASSNYSIAQVNGSLRVYPSLGAGQDQMTAWISAPGQLQVNIHSVKAGKCTIQLFDQQGTRVLQTLVTLAAGFNTQRLPVGNISPGIYHVRVYGPEFILKHKLVIR